MCLSTGHLPLLHRGRSAGREQTKLRRKWDKRWQEQKTDDYMFCEKQIKSLFVTIFKRSLFKSTLLMPKTSAWKSIQFNSMPNEFTRRVCLPMRCCNISRVHFKQTTSLLWQCSPIDSIRSSAEMPGYIAPPPVEMVLRMSNAIWHSKRNRITCVEKCSFVFHNLNKLTMWRWDLMSVEVKHTLRLTTCRRKPKTKRTRRATTDEYGKKNNFISNSTKQCINICRIINYTQNVV